MSAEVIVLHTRSINDVVQLHAYLKNAIGSAYKYVKYFPSNQQVYVKLLISDLSTENALRTSVINYINAYTNPLKSVKSGIQTATTVRMNSFDAFSDSAVKANIPLDMQNYRLFNIPSPNFGLDAVNKNYVDAISAGLGLSKNLVGPTFNVNLASSLELDTLNNIRIASAALGTGLAGGSGFAIQVVPNQPQIISVGSLTDLSVEGVITAKSNLTMSGKSILNLAAPVNPNDATRKTYVDNLITNSAGDGLSSLGTVLKVNVDNFSLEINNDNLRVNPSFIGTGLSGGNGNMLTVNSTLPHVTRLGDLTQLDVTGQVLISSTTLSTSTSTGSLLVSGGVGIQGNMILGGILTTQSGIDAFSQLISNVQTPISGTDAANRAFVESLETTVGDALTKTGTRLDVNVDDFSLQISQDNNLRIASSTIGTGLSGGSGTIISVNQNLSHVTALGNLTGLSVTGVVTLSNASASTGVGTGALRVTGGLYAGGTSVFNNTFTVNGATTLTNALTVSLATDSDNLGSGSVVFSGGVSIAKKLQMGNNINMNSFKVTNVGLPTLSSDVSTKGYVDSLIVTAGSGLVKSGTVIDVVVDSSSIEISNNALRVSSTIAGTGLSGGSGSPLSVNSTQSQITSLGTLSGLSVSGNVTLYSGLNANNARITNVGSPISDNDATTKTYVDTTRPTPGSALQLGSGTDFNVMVDNTSIEIFENKLRIASAGIGTGLSGGSSAVLQVVSSQPQITTVGTLTNLSVSSMGNSFFGNTTDATSSTVAPNVFSGGLAVSKSAFIGGSTHLLSSLNVTGTTNLLGNSILSGTVTIINTEESENVNTGSFITLGGAVVSKNISIGGKINLPDYYTIFTRTAPSTNLMTEAQEICFSNSSIVDEARICVENTQTGGSYTSKIRLFNTGTSTSSDREYLDVSSSLSGAYIRTGGVGTGIRRQLVLNRGISISAEGQATFTGTQTSTSSTTGAVVISNGLGVNGISHFSAITQFHSGIDVDSKRITNVASPQGPYDAANRAYVDSAVQGLSAKQSAHAATIHNETLTNLIPGYVVDGVSVILNDRILVKSQTNAVENGIYIITNTGAVRSDDLDTGSFAKGTFIFINDGDENKASGWIIVELTEGDVVGTDPLEFAQFSAAGQITAGEGMMKDGNILNVLVDGNSIEIVDDALRIASGAVSTGLSGGSGTALSVNSNLSHVTGLGTITTGTWNASTLAVGYGGTGNTGFTTGRLIIGNGSAALNTSSELYFTSSRLYSPNVTIYSTTESTSITTGALVIGGGVGITGNIYVNGLSYFNNSIRVPLPVNDNDVANKSYVDSITPTAGTGLSKTGTILSVNALLPHVTQVGILTGLSSSGIINITNTTPSTSTSSGSLIVSGGVGISESVYIGGTLTVTGYAISLAPVLSSHLTTKGYVDALVTTAGTGLTKIGTSLNVNPNQTQIISLGTLTGLTSSGDVSITSTTISSSNATGAFKVTGGVGIQGSLNVGGTSIFSGSVRVPTPTSATDASTKAYVDSLNPTAGIGLTKTGNEFSVNSAQPVITSLGILTGLSVDGNINVLSNVSNTINTPSLNVLGTTSSTSTTTGALIVNGGVGIAENVNIGGNITFPTNIRIATAVLGPGNVLRIQNTNPTFTETVISSSNSTVSGFYNNKLRLYSMGNALLSNYEFLEFSSSETGASINWNILGTGIMKGLNIYNGALTINSSSTIVSIGTNTTFSVLSTTASTSSSTGALLVAGGMGVVGNISSDATVKCSTLSLPGAVTLTAVSGNYSLKLPLASATKTNSAIVSDLSGNLSFKSLPVQFFAERVAIETVKIYSFTVVTSGGTAVVNLTSDNTTTGTSLFTVKPYSISAVAVVNTSSAIQCATASVKTISANFKVLTLNVVIGTTGVGASQQFAPNGTEVNVTVMGI